MDERSARTRQALLDAAEELFAERGFAAVGSRELVAQAGVNLAAIRYHFGSKRGLYLETVRRSMQRSGVGESWDALRHAPATPAQAARELGAFVRGTLGRLLAEGELSLCARLMLREAMRPSEALHDVVQSFTGPHEELLVHNLRVLAPHAGASEADLRLAARSVLAQIFHPYLFRPFLELHGPPNPYDAASASVLADHVVRFSLRGLGCSPELVELALEPTEAPHDDRTSLETPA